MSKMPQMTELERKWRGEKTTTNPPQGWRQSLVGLPGAPGGLALASSVLR